MNYGSPLISMLIYKIIIYLENLPILYNRNDRAKNYLCILTMTLGVTLISDFVTLTQLFNQ